uniref:Uncharacterized protein n=1 Tax=Zea mays TaxID=4577 RepID=B6TV52_MAIZE|nr:hypothetical protein [Zea mays]
MNRIAMKCTSARVYLVQHRRLACAWPRAGAVPAWTWSAWTTVKRAELGFNACQAIFRRRRPPSMGWEMEWQRLLR